MRIGPTGFPVNPPSNIPGGTPLNDAIVKDGLPAEIQESSLCSEDQYDFPDRWC